VVVDDLDVVCVAAEPTEANTELVVDADAVLAEPIADQLFKTVRWRNLQVGKSGSCVEHDKFAEGNALKIRRESTNFLTLEESFCVVVAKAANRGT
jgi:hypothetical protein